MFLMKFGTRFSNLLGINVQNKIQIRSDMPFLLHDV